MTAALFNRRYGRLIIMSGILFSLVFSMYLFWRNISTFWGPGWDFETACECANILSLGKDPYIQENWVRTPQTINYSPIVLFFVDFVCKMMHVRITSTQYNVGIYFPVYWALAFLTIFYVSFITRKTGYFILMFTFMFLTYVGGFLWTLTSGNFSLFECLFLAVSLSYLYRFCSPNARHQDDLIFALLFGMFCALKSVNVVFVVLFMLLPVTRSRRLFLSGLSTAIGVAPFLLSFLFYKDYMLTVLAALKADNAAGSPGILTFIFVELLGRHHFITSYVIYGAVLLVLLYIFYRANVIPEIMHLSGQEVTSTFSLALAIGIQILPRSKEYNYALIGVALGFYLLSRHRIDRRSYVIACLGIVPAVTLHPLIFEKAMFGWFSQLYFSILSLGVAFALWCKETKPRSVNGSSSLMPQKGAENRLAKLKTQ